MKSTLEHGRGVPHEAPAGIRRVGRTFGLAIAGFGAIVLGAAAFSMWLARQSDASLQPTDFAAIPAAVHRPAPALALADLGGATQQLSDYRGQIVLVNLWATWCPPCQAEMPLLQRFYDRHRADGFTVIAIEDGDPTSEVRSFVARFKLTFPIWLDPQHLATDHAFKTMNLPTSFVIDREGQVRLTWLGAISEANLDKYLGPLIEERQ